jgi:uncharacterized lipoprotein YbaY
MTTLQRVLPGCVAAVLLAACGSSKQPEPPPIKDTAFRDMEAAKDKARAVEGTVMEQKDATDRAISAEEGGTSSQ